MEVIEASSSAEYPRRPAAPGLIPVEELICRTPGAHPIRSIDELSCAAFDTDEELDAFLKFVAESRHADLA